MRAGGRRFARQQVIRRHENGRTTQKEGEDSSVGRTNSSRSLEHSLYLVKGTQSREAQAKPLTFETPVRLLKHMGKANKPYHRSGRFKTQSEVRTATGF